MEQELLTVSVSQVNHYIRRVIEHNSYLKDICILGELSNCKGHPSGHMYLTLKDEGSQLRAVMFRENASRLRFKPEDGMRVRVRGRISVYEPGGVYQLYIDSLEPDGEGALFAAFTALKKKLESEGLFDPVYKKPLPAFPEVISVVTASSGAAVRDIINVLGRRYPLAEVKLFPVTVQGDGSAEEIANAIRTLNREHIGDVMIVGRGGGSIEDLWSFNEEIVARAIFESEIPVISAVGHETDFTIADFVADMRAPTPSAAAELAVPDIGDLKLRINALSNKAKSELLYALQRARSRFERLAKSPALRDFAGELSEKRQQVDGLYEDSYRALSIYLERQKNRFYQAAGKLDALSPLAALSRGYAYADLPDGTAIRSKEQLPAGEQFILHLADGNKLCRAEDER